MLAIGPDGRAALLTRRLGVVMALKGRASPSRSLVVQVRRHEKADRVVA